ncbi:MAG: hypothetical protein ACLRNC_18530, partial [Gemmiger formicilis]
KRKEAAALGFFPCATASSLLFILYHLWKVVCFLFMVMESASIAMFHSKDAPERPTAAVASDFAVAESFASLFATAEVSRTRPALMVVPSVIVRIR